MSDRKDRLNERTQDPEAIERRIVAHWRRGGFRPRTLEARPFARPFGVGRLGFVRLGIFYTSGPDGHWYAGHRRRQDYRLAQEAGELAAYAPFMSWPRAHQLFQGKSRHSFEEHQGWLLGETVRQAEFLRAASDRNFQRLISDAMNGVTAYALGGVPIDPYRVTVPSRATPDWPGAVQRLGEIDAMTKLNNDALRRAP